jgi:hypothetical protein
MHRPDIVHDEALAGTEIQRQLVSRDDAVLGGRAPIQLVDGNLVARRSCPGDRTSERRQCKGDDDDGETFHDHSREGVSPETLRTTRPGAYGGRRTLWPTQTQGIGIGVKSGPRSISRAK